MSERVGAFREERIRHDALIHHKCGFEVSRDGSVPNGGVFRTCAPSCLRGETKSFAIAAGRANLLDSFQIDGSRITIPGKIPGEIH